MPWQVKELFTMKREFCGVCATRGKQHGRTLPAFRHQQGVRLQVAAIISGARRKWVERKIASYWESSSADSPGNGASSAGTEGQTSSLGGAASSNADSRTLG